LAIPYSYPWLVALGYGNSKYCGGTIVAPRFVVTAKVVKMAYPGYPKIFLKNRDFQ